jgi:putative ABC transport system ATP-binding protein
MSTLDAAARTLHAPLGSRATDRPADAAISTSPSSRGGLAIAARGLSKSFGRGAARTQILRGVDLEIATGEIALVMGPSGSGKSTLLAAVSGLLKPDEGEVVSLGEDLWEKSRTQIDKFRLRNCGFIFQGFNLFPALTARQQIEVLLKFAGYRPSERREMAEAALRQVGLGHRLGYRPDKLSGGEKQRVAIARALAKSPRLIFADEPTSALDGENGRIAMELLRAAAKEKGATVLCVTHDVRLATYADRIITIEDGRITSTNADPSRFAH